MASLRIEGYSELLPSSLAFIAPILLVANEIEQENPRVAFICRFHEWEQAHKADPTSSGAGVRKFKTYLLQRLEKEQETKRILASNDTREIQKYYLNFYERNLKKGPHTKTYEEMTKIYHIATVLNDVLKVVDSELKMVDSETERYAEDVKEKKEQYEHYNILPLHAVGPQKTAITELSEGQWGRDFGTNNQVEETGIAAEGRTEQGEDKPPVALPKQEPVGAKTGQRSSGTLTEELKDYIDDCFDSHMKKIIEREEEHRQGLLTQFHNLQEWDMLQSMEHKKQNEEILRALKGLKEKLGDKEEDKGKCPTI